LRTASLAFDALRWEGALIAVMLARIAAQKAGEQAEPDYSIPKGLTLRDEIARYFRIGQALFTGFRAAAMGAPHPPDNGTLYRRRNRQIGRRRRWPSPKNSR
jgi:hypothetical protein